MMLTQISGVPASALPRAALQEHLRLGSGFALAPDQDALLESHLQAALAMIEARTGKALLQRDFRLQLNAWSSDELQPLPLAPVQSLGAVLLRDGAGTATVLAPERYRLLPDNHRPQLQACGGPLPLLPEGGSIVIEFQAGFGPAWGDLPADLRQAVLLLAAEFYEHRSDAGEGGPGLPLRVAALIEGWRLIRVLGGRAR